MIGFFAVSGLAEQIAAADRGRITVFRGSKATQRPRLLSYVVRRQPREEVQMAAARQVVPGLFVIPTGIVNIFLIDAPDGCVLVDAGLPGRDADILRGVAESGRRPTDVRHLIVTALR